MSTTVSVPAVSGDAALARWSDLGQRPCQGGIGCLCAWCRDVRRAGPKWQHTPRIVWLIGEQIVHEGKPVEQAAELWGVMQELDADEIDVWLYGAKRDRSRMEKRARKRYQRRIDNEKTEREAIHNRVASSLSGRRVTTRKRKAA